MTNGWHGWVGTFTGVAIMPVAVLVVGALARRRTAAGDTSAWRRSLAEVGIVCGTVP